MKATTSVPNTFQTIKTIQAMTDAAAAATAAAELTADCLPQSAAPERLSKSRAKKLAKQQRYQELKLERKAAEKAHRKETKHALKRQREEVFQNMSEAEQQVAKERAAMNRELRRREALEKTQRMRASLGPGNLRVAIDLDFEEFMVESDQKHLCQQLAYSYSCNLRSATPVHLQLVGLGGKMAKLIAKQLPGMVHWHVTCTELPWADFYHAELDKVVYLTADSPNEIEDLSHDKIYIVGGLVDHNKHKGLCYKRATEAGAATARLPIQRHVKLDTSAVLTVNHVVQLLVEYYNRRDWPRVLEEVLPKRKRADCRQAKRAADTAASRDKSDKQDKREDNADPADVASTDDADVSPLEGDDQHAAAELDEHKNERGGACSSAQQS